MQLEAICKGCPRKCCKGPGLSSEEYARILHAVGQKALDARPHFNGRFWKFQSEECPALGPDGCVLVYEERPILCRMAPFVPIPTTDGTALLLDVGMCPMWQSWGQMHEVVRREFEGEEFKI